MLLIPTWLYNEHKALFDSIGKVNRQADHVEIAVSNWDALYDREDIMQHIDMG